MYFFPITLGISKQLWASIPIWSVFLLSSFLHSHHLPLRCTSCSIPASPCSCFLCEGLFASTKYSVLWGEDQKHGSHFNFSKNNPLILMSCVKCRECTLYVCSCVSYMVMHVSICQSVWQQQTNILLDIAADINKGRSNFVFAFM